MNAKELLNEYLDSGHGCCPGCAMPIVLRNVFHSLGENTIVVITAGCFGTISGAFPTSPIKLASYNTPFASAGAAASGVRAALDIQGNTTTTVLAVAGDGGTFDIGIQALSAAAERNDDFIYLCYDNEAYMNTGIQRSSATPWGAWTTTTPPSNLKNQPKKDIVQIMAAHRIPYVATVSIAYPEDFIRKIEKAKSTRGFKFIYAFSPCPVGWRFSSELTIRLARLAVQTKLFPLYEVENGEQYILNEEPEGVPVNDYLRLQGRFGFLREGDVERIQKNVDEEWQRLMTRMMARGT
ncbi:MAG: 2-ketoisovalerate ferredoxin oxidoreductase [Deltaproteobacteria bacterium RBG_19FT_COMBO_52_11]|jgi:pyruvate/2-oxoacid:ferredoxin oxidoreductase beta subunit|nr:MAG: 2-ketoisovalerate ferredoxin oxidoreductase [Deltaproteobacteria bacterium RBG_19FT_COMBO_52_11]